jgi:hypothetical protein
MRGAAQMARCKVLGQIVTQMRERLYHPNYYCTRRLEYFLQRLCRSEVQYVSFIWTPNMAGRIIATATSCVYCLRTCDLDIIL